MITDRYTNTEYDAGLFEAEFGPEPDDLDGPDADIERENAILVEYDEADYAAVYDAAVERHGEPHYLNADLPF